MNVERSELLQICAVDYGCDPDGPTARVVDAMEVSGCNRRLILSAKWLRDQHQEKLANSFVFVRKVTIEVRKYFERIA